MTGTQISSVAPGYTVDSKTTVAPRFRFPPTASLRRKQRPEVGLVRIVDRRRHGDDDEVCGTQRRRVGRAAQAGSRSQLGAAYFASRIDAPAVGGDLGLGQIEPDCRIFLAELDGERKPDVAQPDDADGGVLRFLPCSEPAQQLVGFGARRGRFA